jgi:quinoprotein glucose dehydrogenase
MSRRSWAGVAALARLSALVLALAPSAGAGEPGTPVAGWSHTEGNAAGWRYSPLEGIHRGNVGRLEPLWTYRHGDVRVPKLIPDRVNRGTAFEGTPILVGRTLVLTTPFNRVIALDAATGEERWTFDPEIDRDQFFANMLINRGVALWRGDAGDTCRERVFLATLDARLIALDVATGAPCDGFGTEGSVDLTRGIEPLVDPQEYNMTSPPTVVGDVVIVGSSVADTIRRQAPPGDVRGFDARTGALRWTFHTLPRPGTFGSETWRDGSAASGAANVWTTMTADLERGLVFLPVSTPSPDYYGGHRVGSNLFSDTLVALDAATGERRWHFQTVHHDLWDYDLASPASLVRVRHGDRDVDAVALPTKQGFVFVLDRETGEPLFPVEERPVPASEMPGEEAWPTQPFPTRPPPLVKQHVRDADLWADDPRHLAKCREKLAGLRNEGLFTPPSERGMLEQPFSAGGANWSGSGFDPARRLLFVPVNDRAHVIRLDRLPESNVERVDGQPMRNYWNGLRFVLRGRGTGLRYRLHPLAGRTPFSVGGKHCTAPPWGWLVAVDLDRGEIAWRQPAGEEDGIRGLTNFGHVLVAGGLVFHAGTRELALRAHDVETGEVVARIPLPAGLHAGPITYQLSPEEPQLLVVAPGGHIGLGSEPGDHVIGFRVPD